MYNEVRLDKSMYNLANKGFSQALRELDPDEQYKGTELEGLDAFERQLKRFDIRVTGNNSDLVDKFFQSGESAALFPEFVSRSVRQGMKEQSALGEVVAAFTRINGLDYRPIACKGESTLANLTTSNLTADITAEGAQLKSTSLVLSDKLVTLRKLGRMLEASYESVRYQRIDLFAVTLKQVGAAIAQSQLKEAVNYIISCATDASITSISSAGAKLSYADLVALWASFGERNMTTLLVSPATMAAILTLPELAERVEGKYMTNPTIKLPFGANVVKTSALADDTIIGLDKSCALEMVVADELTVESDKLINKQTERTAITSTAGFSLIFADAVGVLTIE